MRVYPTFTNQIFILLTWLKYVHKTDFNTIYSEVYKLYRNGNVDPLTSTALKLAKIEYLDPPESTDELLDAIRPNILQEKRNDLSSEGDLIDVIIEALKLPFGGSVLAGRVLSKLRKALLIPSELQKLKEILDKQELFCASCGSPITTMESICFRREVGADRPTIMCGKCAIPEKVKCPECDLTIPFRKRFRPIKYKNGDCEIHAKEQILEEPEEVQVAPAPNIDIPQRVPWAPRVRIQPNEVARGVPLEWNFNPAPGLREGEPFHNPVPVGNPNDPPVGNN